MSVPAISSATHALSAVATSSARAADGDYKARTLQSAQTRDSDGDYKPLAATTAPVAQSASGVQTALAALKVGG